MVENIVSGEESNLKTLPVGGNIVQIPANNTMCYQKSENNYSSILQVAQPQITG